MDSNHRDSVAEEYRTQPAIRNSDFGILSGFGSRAWEFRPRQHAFTLVEMLLVLVILATLAAIVYPKLAGRSEQARATATQTQIASFSTALDAFEVDNGYYPKGKSGLVDLVQKPQDAQNWHGPYLKEIPQDPWGHDYIYECPGKHNSSSSYDLTSAGPDGRTGDDDDITNWQNKK